MKSKKKNIYKGSYSPNNYLESGMMTNSPMMKKGGKFKYPDGGNLPINLPKTKDEILNTYTNVSPTNSMKGLGMEEFNNRFNTTKNAKEKENILKLKAEFANLIETKKRGLSEINHYRLQASPELKDFLDQTIHQNIYKKIGITPPPERLKITSDKFVDSPINFSDEIQNAAKGGNLTEYNGPSHEDGGITLGGNKPFAEVEGKETERDNGGGKYVFPDKGFKTPGGKTIYVPGTKKTFAEQSKVYNNSLKLRPWDHITKDYVDSKLNELQQVHQEIKDSLDATALARFEKKNPGVVEKVADQIANEKLQQITAIQQPIQNFNTPIAARGGNIGNDIPKYKLGDFLNKVGSKITDVSDSIPGLTGLSSVGKAFGLGSDAELGKKINSTQAEQLTNNGQYDVKATSINAPNTINAEQANYNNYIAQGYNAATYNPAQLDASILKNSPGYVGDINTVNTYNPISARQFVKSDNSEAIKNLEDSRNRTVRLAMQSDSGNPFANAMVADAIASKNKANIIQDYGNQQANARNAYNQYVTSVDEANAAAKTQNTLVNSNIQAQNLNRKQNFNDIRLNTALDINKTNVGYENQAGQFNTASRNQANQFNIGAQNEANRYNAAMNYEASANNANLRQNTNQFNTNMQYNINAANAGFANQANMYNAQNKLGIDQFNIGERDAITSMKLGYANQSNNSRIQQNQANKQMLLDIVGLGMKANAKGGKLNRNRYNFNYKK